MPIPYRGDPEVLATAIIRAGYGRSPPPGLLKSRESRPGRSRLATARTTATTKTPNSAATVKLRSLPFWGSISAIRIPFRPDAFEFLETLDSVDQLAVERQ